MVGIFSSGEWIRKRRETLGLTRKALAERVVCSIDTIKKIEGDIRRPSVQIGELLATHLHIPKKQASPFLQFVRGNLTIDLFSPERFLPGANPTPDPFAIMERLEALPDQKLFGIDSLKNQAFSALSEQNRPWLISFEGLGGLGKTTLADSVVRQFVDTNNFSDIGWVSAKQEHFVTGRGIHTENKPALNSESLIDQLILQLTTGPFPVGDFNAKRLFLMRHLKETATLVVIDNLETVVDYESLLPLLRTLAQPSKFILTSRMSLQNESDVFCLSLQELSPADAFALLRHEAKTQRIGPLMAADDSVLEKIYKAVGGNPLALKLIMGQAHFLPLDRILNNLKRSSQGKLNDLLAYIYWQAWEMLDPKSRTLLVSLPLAPNGSFDQLTRVSQLDDMAVGRALAQLRNLSLVEVKGDIDSPRYQLHRLTETFVMNDLLRWEAAPLLEASATRDLFTNNLNTTLNHWHGNTKTQDSNFVDLEAEQEGILRALCLGLQSGSDWQVLKELIFSLASYMERRGNWGKWESLLVDALEVAQTEEDIEGKIELMGLYGRILQRQQKTDLVISNYRHTIRLARSQDFEIEAARAASNLGFALVRKKCWWRIEILLCFALEIFDRHNHQHGQAHTNNHLGILFQHRQMWDQAINYLEKACRIWEEIEDSQGLISGYQNLGFLYNDLKMPEKAIACLEKSDECVALTGDESQRAVNYANIAVSFDLLGDLAQAKKFGMEALSRFQAQENFNGVCFVWEIMGTISKHQNRIDESERYYTSALNGYQNLGNVIGEQHLLELMK